MNPYPPMRTPQKGFIALISVIIVSTILMGFVFSLNTSGFFAQLDAYSGQYKRTALSLAESCTNAALLKLAQDYAYDYTNDSQYGPIPYNLAKNGVEVDVNGDKCYITGVSYSINGSPATLAQRQAAATSTATITTQAQFPPVNGAFSNVTTRVTVENPTYTSVIVPPTCTSFGFSTPPANPTGAGTQLTLRWNISNAQSLVVKRVTNGGGTTQIYSGTQFVNGSVDDWPNESATYALIATGQGGSQTQCAAVSVSVKQSLGNCADTVMMLDRTGGFFTGTNPQDEKNAVYSMLGQSMYGGLSPRPQIAVGSFGGLDGSKASIASIANPATSGTLTTNYGTAGGSNVQVVLAPAATSTILAEDNWTSNVLNKSGAVTSNDVDATYINTTNNGTTELYTYIPPVQPVVPNNATNISVSIAAYVKKTNAGGNSPRIQFLTRNGGNTYTNPTSYTISNTSYATTTATLNRPQGGGWLPADINSGSLKFGVTKVSNTQAGTATVRATYIVVTVSYTVPSTGHFLLTDTITAGPSGVGTWLDEAIKKGKDEIIKSSKQRVFILISDGGVRDPANPNNTAPLVKNAITQAGVATTSPNNIQIYAINYGNATNAGSPINGQTLMKTLASPDTVIASISNISRAGGNVTVTTASAHGLAVGQGIRIAGVSLALNTPNGGISTITSVPSPTVFTYAQTGANSASNIGTVLAPHFFIPGAGNSNMTAIFNAIAYNVCPALSTPSAPQDPPAPPVPPPPIPNIDVNSWQESPIQVEAGP